MATVLDESAVATAMPTTVAAAWAKPSSPDTVPRWRTGTWSASSAMSTDIVAAKPSWATTQPTVITGRLGATATTSGSSSTRSISTSFTDMSAPACGMAAIVANVRRGPRSSSEGTPGHPLLSRLPPR
jgi:hypothetical protein